MNDNNRNGKHPIIAHGEEYYSSITKKHNKFDKSFPKSYDEAKAAIISDINNLEEDFKNSQQYYMSEKIVCIRMEPGFEAKSYIPTSIEFVSNDSKIVGGRKYHTQDSSGNNTVAKLYFLRTTNNGITSIKNVLLTGEKDSIESWKDQIRSIKSFDQLSPDEKAMGFDPSWTFGTVEFVIHPFSESCSEILQFFNGIAKISDDCFKIKKYENGPTFISAKCSISVLEKAKLLNPLRSIQPLGHVDFSFERSIPGNTPPKINKNIATGNTVEVGVFDGGVKSSIPLLNGYVSDIDCVGSERKLNLECHGTEVCSAILYGNLGNSQEVATPCASITSFRVLPLLDNNDFELYEAIDAIEEVVPENPRIKLYNISFGPKGAICDDNISRFTYALDKLTYNKGKNINPLFCIAAGNDGSLDTPFNRIQAPSDMVNGLCVGAYTRDSTGDVIRAEYSCVGIGREGAKVKPDLLEFGGSCTCPVILAGSNPNYTVGDAGTSFAAPIAVHKISNIMAASNEIEPHMARTLLLNSAQIKNGYTKNEQGYGFSLSDVNDILYCDDKNVTILYNGVISPKKIIKLPIFAPKIHETKGKVNIKWTISTIVDPCVNDSDAYTNNCLEDTFVPNEFVYGFTKGKTHKKINFLKPESAEKAQGLIDQGFKKSDFPLTHSDKKFWTESELRSKDLKWDTIIKRQITMLASSLCNPYLTLHAMSRNEYDGSELKYFVALTISAPKYPGSLYDQILQTYHNLTSINVRDINRVDTTNF